MDVSRHPTARQFCAALVLLVAVGTPAKAGADGVSCELKIRGHSIVRLMLVEKTRHSGVQFEKPGESVQLPAGEYRVETVELEDNYALTPQLGQRQDWFEVTPAGPNELVVGAPLYPTATATRHGGFVQLDYDTVDAAGRSYRQTAGRAVVEPPDVGPDGSWKAPPAGRAVVAPPPPTFTVYKDGQEIGSGSFEYG